MQGRNSALLIDKHLRGWEDYMFNQQMNCLLKGIPPQGAFLHWPSFRKYLLTYRAGEVFDPEKLYSPPDKKNPDDLSSIEIPALEIAGWVSCSKRIFRLNQSMQDRLSEINIGNIRMSDVVLPFPSFAIQLTTPITYEGVVYDFLLLSNYPALKFAGDERISKVAAITAMARTGLHYKGIPLSRDQKLKVLHDLGSPSGKTKAKERLLAMLRGYDYEKDFAKICSDHSFAFPLNRDCTIEEYLQQIENQLSQFEALQLRIFFNLCIYLQSLPLGMEVLEGAEWKKETPRMPGVKNIITEPTEVCDIHGSHIIDSMIRDERSPQEKNEPEKIVKGGWHVNVHWRRAHMRRPPGKGNDPTAEKTVKVRYTLVHGNLMPKVGVTAGSLSEIIG